MAKGKIMLQIEILQQTADEVTFPPLNAYVVGNLDGDTAVVHEISTQKTGGVSDIAFTVGAFGRLWLVFPNKEPQKMNAPSHVPSPPIEGAGMVVLDVSAPGLDFSSKVSGVRTVGAHVYLEETKTGIDVDPVIPAPDTDPVIV